MDGDGMYRQRPLKTVAEALLISRLIWFALFVSQGVYLYVGRLLISDSAVAGSSDLAVQPVGFLAALQNPTGLAFLAAAGMALTMSFVVPKLLNPEAVPVAPGQPVQALESSKLPDRLRARLARFIVGAAINESVAIFGLVGGYLTMKNAEFGSALVYASLAGMLIRFPTTESFADPVGVRR